ncbi:hypothetical protein KKB43_03020 [Patescibacteria group bacterium]|nr:hypothetical protein [Patescibacteria group bacterium]MBU4141969.1 hypothetical protein [Patescibacteria group bacterium]MBU4338641.1 hypothetical protein [Patescibacteria group bacterium]MBU4579965.1 hypothetical protein [Patescibacteria group bacterium]
MRNNTNSKIKEIFSLVKSLPYFGFDNLAGIEKNRVYLKILFYRYKKAGKLIGLKKGVYVSREYIDKIEKSGTVGFYAEFIANILYIPSYLSLEYVLYEHNILTEIPVNITSISKNKTARFSNEFGNFLYHKIKSDLFTGFTIVKKGDFIIFKATKAKALFDFLYFRKNLIMDRKAFLELRLNLENLNKKDLSELKKYINIEGSKKMKEILSYF